MSRVCVFEAANACEQKDRRKPFPRRSYKLRGLRIRPVRGIKFRGG